MIADLGTKLVKFVAKMRRGMRAPGVGSGAGKITRTLNLPFQPVIFADGQYAIFDDMADFKVDFKPEVHDFDNLCSRSKLIRLD